MSETRPLLQQQYDPKSHIEERERDVKHIESQMIVVNEIYRDLSVIVSQQGQELNSIEANIDSTSEYVESGTQHINKAAKYQKSSRSYLCVLLMLLLVIITIVAIIVSVEVRKKK